MGRFPGCLWILLHTDEHPLSLKEAECIHLSNGQTLNPQPGDKCLMATTTVRKLRTSGTGVVSRAAEADGACLTASMRSGLTTRCQSVYATCTGLWAFPFPSVQEEVSRTLLLC